MTRTVVQRLLIRTLVFLFTLLMISTLIYSSSTVPVVEASNMLDPVNWAFTPSCYDLYILEALDLINNTWGDRVPVLIPGNMTFDGLFNQSSWIIYTYNIEFDEATGQLIINLRNNTGFYGFYLLKTHVCEPMIFSTIINILSNPQIYKGYTDIPQDVASEYILEPHPIVNATVRKAFEDWLRNEFNYTIDSMSMAGIAAYAAYFIYGQFYIAYNPSPYPRSIEEVVETRQGDCDDMSRVLVNLLWSYDIPAAMAYGYTFASEINLTISMGNLTWIQRGLGPHAFVIAYIPPLGWISLDLLAGSLLKYPFTVFDITTDTSVNESEVNEAKNFYNRLIGIGLTEALTGQELNEILSLSDDPITALSIYINNTLEEAVPPTTITVTETTTHTIIVTETTTVTEKTTLTTTQIETTTITSTETVTQPPITIILTKTQTTTTTMTSSTTYTTTMTETQTSTVTKPDISITIIIGGSLLLIGLGIGVLIGKKK